MKIEKDSSFKIVDYSDWKVYEGISEGSGRSEKQWLESPNGIIGLFKWPKTDPQTGASTYEHISEHLAYQIGTKLDIPTSKVDIGKYNNRIGSMSYRINDNNEALIEGAHFLLGHHPNYNLDTLYDVDTKKYYSIEHLFEITDSPKVHNFWIEMLFFDFLIGNSDRHQNNWGFLFTVIVQKKKVKICPCPLYDNGSSLCCYINDTKVEELIYGEDKMKFKALVDSKSKSLIRINPLEKKLPRHSEMVKYLLQNYNYSYEIADRIKGRITDEYVESLLVRYPDEILTSTRKKLIENYLLSKVSLLEIIEREVRNEKCS